MLFPLIIPTDALREVRPLLASLSAAGRGAAGCLAKAVSLLSQKKALRAKQVAKGVEGLISAALRASAEAATAAGGDISASVARIARAEAQGAWILLKEVAACDPSAPSWQFLQAAWARLQEQGRSAAGKHGRPSHTWRLIITQHHAARQSACHFCC